MQNKSALSDCCSVRENLWKIFIKFLFIYVYSDLFSIQILFFIHAFILHWLWSANLRGVTNSEMWASHEEIVWVLKYPIWFITKHLIIQQLLARVSLFTIIQSGLPSIIVFPLIVLTLWRQQQHTLPVIRGLRFDEHALRYTSQL